LKRLDRQFVSSVFFKFADECTSKILASKFPFALKELNIEAIPGTVAELFKEADLDEDGGLDLDEFYRVINRPSELEQWCLTLPLPKLLAFCLETVITPAGEFADPIRSVCNLSPQDLDLATSEFEAGLRQLLKDQTQQLDHCYEQLAIKVAEKPDGSSAKFQTPAMSGGTAEEFHKGLADRVGEYAIFCVASASSLSTCLRCR
jgi:hypothetical protein